MSRLAIKPIQVPSGVEINISANIVKVKGPKGELERDFSRLGVAISNDKELKVEKKAHGDSARWGLAHALLSNMIKGVHEGFTKTLEIHGVGYRAAVNGKNIKLELGMSHDIELPLPEGIEAKVQKNQIILEGFNNERLGDFAAEVRSLRPPEPYKGKGIRYLGEFVRQKEGKKAVAEGEGS